MNKQSMVFCFGSNLVGVHGAGAARYAFDYHGAVWYQGVGLYGNSYAIPTKGYSIETLPLHQIKGYVNMFVTYALLHPELTFKVTQIGCGLAGYTSADIAPMFIDAPDNCLFDKAWAEYLPHHKYWN